MNEGNLRERLHSVQESQTLTIFMTFEHTGWVRYNIDSQLGALSIQSDWGDWQHVWGGGPSSWGHPTFVDFLKRRADYHYLTDKLHYGGRTRKVIDGDATRKAMIGRIARARLGELVWTAYNGGQYRRVTEIDRDRASDLREGVEEFVDSIEDKSWSGGGDAIWAAFQRIEEEAFCDNFRDFFYDVHDLIEEKDHPRLVFLRDQLLPLMVAYLRGEIRVGDDGKPIRVEVAEGEAGVAGGLPGRDAPPDETVPGG